MNEKKVASLQRKVQRYGLAESDMRQAIAGIRVLLEGDIDGDARRCLETGVVTCYARPFTESRGLGVVRETIPASEAGARVVHQELIDQRRKVYAHNDATEHRRIVEFPFGDETIVREQWQPIARWDIVRQLAEWHLAVFAQRGAEARDALGDDGSLLRP